MHRRKDNIKMHYREIFYDLIHMDQDGIRWRILLNTVMIFGVGGECVDCMTSHGSLFVPRSWLHRSHVYHI
jgi:hypothetical protein